MFSTLSKTEIIIWVISIYRLQMLSIWSCPKFCLLVKGIVQLIEFHFERADTVSVFDTLPQNLDLL